jgi:riboflavin transporter FmnP
MTALAYILLFVRLHLIPAAPYLNYDPADIPLMITGFLLGPLAGLVSAAIVVILEAFTLSFTGPWGAVMHFAASATIVLISSLIYRLLSRKKRTAGETSLKSEALPLMASLLVAAICFVIVMLLANILITPIFTGMPRDAIMKLLLPIFLPFNALKALINITLTYFSYLAVSRFVKQP